MAKFEHDLNYHEQFGIPKSHTLVEVKYRQSGHNGGNEYWIYEQRDESGTTIARFKVWDDAFPADKGWVKL